MQRKIAMHRPNTSTHDAVTTFSDVPRPTQPNDSHHSSSLRSLLESQPTPATILVAQLHNTQREDVEREPLSGKLPWTNK